MTRQLRQQRAADTLNRKGKRCVLQHGHMAGLHDSFQKCALILGRYPLAQGVNIGFGIAQLCAQGAYLLGQGRVGNQFHMQMRFRHGNLSKLLYFYTRPRRKSICARFICPVRNRYPISASKPVAVKYSSGVADCGA